MASTVTPLQIENDTAKQASKPRRVKARTENVGEPVDEAAALESFKALMQEYGGKCSFDGCDSYRDFELEI